MVTQSQAINSVSLIIYHLFESSGSWSRSTLDYGGSIDKLYFLYKVKLALLRIVCFFFQPYDYSSVMHYGAKDFSKNNQDVSQLKNLVTQLVNELTWLWVIELNWMQSMGRSLINCWWDFLFFFVIFKIFSKVKFSKIWIIIF